VKAITTAVLKGREVALKKRQFGLGLVVTNLMVAVVFGPWSFTLMDRRAA